MRKLEYQLVKEDYKNWIHWNVVRNQSKKMKFFSMCLYMGFIVLFLGRNIVSAKGNMAVIIPSVAVAALVGVGMYYMTSVHNQEQIIWKKSGLRKLEQTNRFPYVYLTMDEKGVTLEVPQENAKQYYNYREIVGIVENERLYLLETANKNCQFVAKSAFENQEDADAFKAQMEAIIEDAKENPEKYEEESAKTADGAEESTVTAAAASSDERDASEEDEPEITPVDTSSMGKIGKMAHIMASMAAEAEAEESAEAAETEVSADAKKGAEAAETEAGPAEKAPVSAEAETGQAKAAAEPEETERA